jgi:hypothetical protein
MLLRAECMALEGRDYEEHMRGVTREEEARQHPSDAMLQQVLAQQVLASVRPEWMTSWQLDVLGPQVSNSGAFCGTAALCLTTGSRARSGVAAASAAVGARV